MGMENPKKTRDEEIILAAAQKEADDNSKKPASSELRENTLPLNESCEHREQKWEVSSPTDS